MPYAPSWTNANEQGRLSPGVHFIRHEDTAEVAAAINRRRRLVYLTEQDFSSQVGPGKPVRAATLATQTPPPFRCFRAAITADILLPATGGMGNQPPTPAGMDWLWPVAGDDEDKVIVVGDPGPGQVGLFAMLNGSDDWTGPVLTGGQSPVRAVHFNELRQAIEWIRRGRWRLPVYFSGGIISLTDPYLRDTPWIGNTVANDGADEVRSIGFALARTTDAPPRGLTNVTVRSSTRLEITADADCRLEVYHCLRPIDFTGDPPTWNEYDPSASAAWAEAGGLGEGDATYIGAVDLAAEVTGEVSGAALTAAVQAMLEGAEQNLLVRRADTGPETINIAPVINGQVKCPELIVEFDLDSPPN